jgi:hypothetical protein
MRFCASSYICSNTSTAGAFQLGVVWPLSLHTAFDLAPSNNQRFSNNEEFTGDAKTWLTLHVADFFDTGIQKLIL